MHNPLDSRAIAMLRADHAFGGHTLLRLAECPLCTHGAYLGTPSDHAREHERGEHRGRPIRKCGYCVLYVLRPVPAAPIARPARPLALPAPRRRQLAPLPAAPVLLALPERASARHALRESWLSDLREALRPAFEAAGAPIPARVRVTCGFPSKGARPSKRQTIGQCHYQTADRVPDLCVSPVLDAPELVAATLVHELIHAVYPQDGHGSQFGKAARKLGLTGSLTATSAGPLTLALLAPILAQLGPYPHAKIDLAGIKRQGTRMLLVKCPDVACGYQVRTTAKWLAIGVPTCPCGELMVAPDLETDDDDGDEALAADRRGRRVRA